MTDIDNNYVSKETVNELLPYFTDTLLGVMQENDQTDFILFTDYKGLVDTIANTYPEEDSKVWVRYKGTRLSLFSDVYDLWLIHTAGAHPVKHFLKPADHVLHKSIITEPEKYEKFTKKMIKKYPELLN